MGDAELTGVRGGVNLSPMLQQKFDNVGITARGGFHEGGTISFSSTLFDASVMAEENLPNK